MRAEPVHVRLGPETHPLDARVEAWRAALGFSHDVAVRPVDRADFRASFDRHHLGAVTVADMRASTLVATRDAALIARHAFAAALDRVEEGPSSAGPGTPRSRGEPGRQGYRWTRAAPSGSTLCEPHL